MRARVTGSARCGSAYSEKVVRSDPITLTWRASARRPLPLRGRGYLSPGVLFELVGEDIFEPCAVGGEQADFDVHGGFVVGAVDYLAMLVQPGQPRTVLRRDCIVRQFHAGGNAHIDRGTQRVQTLAGD